MTSILRFSGASRPSAPLTLVYCLTAKRIDADRDDERDLVAAKRGETGIRTAASRDDWQGPKTNTKRFLIIFLPETAPAAR